MCILFTISFCAHLLPGNILVVYVIVRHRRIRHVTSFFLVNLAVSDLGVGVFCVLQQLAVYMSPIWLIGRVRILHLSAFGKYNSDNCI